MSFWRIESIYNLQLIRHKLETDKWEIPWKYILDFRRLSRKKSFFGHLKHYLFWNCSFQPFSSRSVSQSVAFHSKPIPSNLEVRFRQQARES